MFLTFLEAKEQVTANLANFAYDPINYEYLKKHSILNIFLDLLSSSNEKLIEHGLTGVCNFCTDEQIRLVILEESNLELLRLLLQLTNEQIILKILTTFALIITEENKLRILLPDVRDRIQELLALSEEKIYSRIKNYLLILKEFF